jgi:hypothetical protein
MNENVLIDFQSEQASFKLKPAELKTSCNLMKIDETTEIIMIRGALENETVKFSFQDDDFVDDCYYYVRVTQVDGEEAWASPIYVSGK